MKTIKLIVSLILLAGCQMNSQSIVMENSINGTHFYQNDEEVVLRDLVSMLQNDKETKSLITTAQANYVTSRVIAIVGAGIVAFPIGISTAGIKPNWKIGLVGAGLILISIPIYSEGNRNAKKAIEIYNSKLNPTSSHSNIYNYELIVNKTSVGVRINF